MDNKLNSAEAKILISQLLAKALVAVVKLLKTKILPRATERYCKNLQKFAEKLVQKSNELVDKLPKVDDVKKRVSLLYVLRLIKETVGTVGRALLELEKHIETTVDFKEIDLPTTPEAMEAVVALNNLTTLEDDPFSGGCGPDGCEIV